MARSFARLRHQGIRVGEIIAYRAWRVLTGGIWFWSSDDRLHSVFMRDYVWHPDQPASGDVQTYGIYSFRDVIRSRGDYGYGSQDGSLLFGKVKIWGEVVEHEEGYRWQNREPRLRRSGAFGQVPEYLLGQSCRPYCAMNFISSLPTVVTEHGNGRFAARVNRSRRGCGMVRLTRRRLPLRLAKSHSGNFWSLWNSDRKTMPKLRRSTSGGNGVLEMTNENLARLLRGLTIAVRNRNNRILFYQFLAAEIRALDYSYGSPKDQNLQNIQTKTLEDFSVLKKIPSQKNSVCKNNRSRRLHSRRRYGTLAGSPAGLGIPLSSRCRITPHESK